MKRTFQPSNIKRARTHGFRARMRTKDGVKVEEEIIERGTKSGAMNFFERWSRKKQLHKKVNK